MPKHSGNLSIRPELVKQPSEDYNLATGQAHCIDVVVSDNDHLPIDPVKVTRLRLRPLPLTTVPALSDPPVIQNLVVSLGRSSRRRVLARGPTKHRGSSVGIAILDGVVVGDIAIPIRGVVALVAGEATVHGADDLRGDEADADAVGVERGQDLGPELLLEFGEQGLAELAIELGREDDEVGAVGVGHGLEVAEVEGDRPAPGDEDRRGELPLVVVPPGPAAAAGEVDELLPPGGVVVPRAGQLRRRRRWWGDGGLAAENARGVERVVPGCWRLRRRRRSRRRGYVGPVAEESREDGARVPQAVHAVLFFGVAFDCYG
jgi:hypothetical protein